MRLQDIDIEPGTRIIVDVVNGMRFEGSLQEFFQKEDDDDEDTILISVRDKDAEGQIDLVELKCSEILRIKEE
ncbi:MAG: hypothetical protein LKF61_03285 [Eggerthellaceae bacterium]|jgi:hypothetical protein|nr:hypothetical protein [Eggerthellaceae bacterium]